MSSLKRECTFAVISSVHGQARSQPESVDEHFSQGEREQQELRTSGQELRMLLPELVLDDVNMHHRGKALALSCAVTVAATDQLHTADDHGTFAETRRQLIVVNAKLAEQQFVLEVC
jgi:hypothetical protein